MLDNSMTCCIQTTISVWKLNRSVLTIRDHTREVKRGGSWSARNQPLVANPVFEPSVLLQLVGRDVETQDFECDQKLIAADAIVEMRNILAFGLIMLVARSLMDFRSKGTPVQRSASANVVQEITVGRLGQINDTCNAVAFRQQVVSVQVAVNQVPHFRFRQRVEEAQSFCPH
jgi:hypothetical protein